MRRITKDLNNLNWQPEARNDNQIGILLILPLRLSHKSRPAKRARFLTRDSLTPRANPAARAAEFTFCSLSKSSLGARTEKTLVSGLQDTGVSFFS